MYVVFVFETKIQMKNTFDCLKFELHFDFK